MFVRHSNVSAVKVREEKKKEHLKRPCVHDSHAGSRLWFCWCNRWLLKGFLMEGLRGETWSRVKALHHTIQRPLPWLMKRQTFTVKPRVWECKERRGSGEYGWKKSKSSPSHAITENDTWHFELNLFRIAILAVNYRTNHPRPFLSPPLVSVGNACERRDEPSQRERSVKSSDISRADTTFDLDAPSALEVKSNQWVAG